MKKLGIKHEGKIIFILDMVIASTITFIIWILVNRGYINAGAIFSLGLLYHLYHCNSEDWFE